MDVTIGTAGAQAQVIAPCGLMPARQTCAQRQNVPALRSHGLESELEWQPNPTWEVNGGYAYSPTG
jgi:outer membrane receptor protein involved in Fe transport